MASDWRSGVPPFFTTLAQLMTLQLRVERLNYLKQLQSHEAYLKTAGADASPLLSIKYKLTEEMLTRRTYDLTVPPVPALTGNEPLKHLVVTARKG